VIYENASIVFDENPPIDTEPIFYTVDRSAPTVVVVNATQLQSSTGDVLVQFDTVDTGSGTRSVDLYRVSDADELSLYRARIDESAVVLRNLPADRALRMAAVASDNVGNVGAINADDVFTVIVKQPCPNDCSGNGDCLASGLCRCASPYVGQDCRVERSSVVEPPILEISHPNMTTVNTPLAMFVSARLVRESVENETLEIRLFGFARGTVFSKGRTVKDVVHLAEEDFGVVTLTPPSEFTGILIGTAEAVLWTVDHTSSRSVGVSVSVVHPSTTSEMTSVGDSTTVSALPSDGWGPWSEFGPCSRTCDLGVHQRSRTCLSSSRCSGDDVQYQLCNIDQPCPGMCSYVAPAEIYLSVYSYLCKIRLTDRK